MFLQKPSSPSDQINILKFLCYPNKTDSFSKIDYNNYCISKINKSNLHKEKKQNIENYLISDNKKWFRLKKVDNIISYHWLLWI